MQELYYPAVKSWMQRPLMLFLGILTITGCTGEQWGFPRVPVRAASPDGRFVAYVKNHPSTDPPDQTLWLQSPTGRDASLSADGSAITFLECERIYRKVAAARQNRRGTRMESSIANCADARQTVAFGAALKAAR